MATASMSGLTACAVTCSSLRSKPSNSTSGFLRKPALRSPTSALSGSCRLSLSSRRRAATVCALDGGRYERQRIKGAVEADVQQLELMEKDDEMLDLEVELEEEEDLRADKPSHYEICMLIHPDEEENAVNIFDSYRGMAEGCDGQVHRKEDWGLRDLAYPIHKVKKAHYFLLNIECLPRHIETIKTALEKDERVLRFLAQKVDRAYTEPSVIMQKKNAGPPKATKKP